MAEGGHPDFLSNYTSFKNIPDCEECIIIGKWEGGKMGGWECR
jgi:hypothetical protein